ncbi:hypothetical protein D9M70_583480 [compost metagenome]
MEATAAAQTESRHILLALDGHQQRAEQLFQLRPPLSQRLDRLQQESRRNQRIDQRLPFAGQFQMHAAAVARVRFFFDQALGFQGLQRLRHGSFGEAKELRHAQRRIRVAIATR